MWERNIDQLPPACTRTRTKPTTQAWALTRNQMVTFCFAGWHPMNQATPVRANHMYSFFKDFLYYFFREKGREGERAEQKHQCVRNIDWLPLVHPQLGTKPATQTLPWQVMEPVTFGLQGGAQSTEPHQPGLNHMYFYKREQREIWAYTQRRLYEADSLNLKVVASSIGVM